MNVLYENIPAQLVRLDRWVVWRYEERNGKLTKPPYVPAIGKKRHALVNVPSTWGTFEQAKNTCKSGGFDGIGFVLGQGIFGIDFDHATDEMVKEALSLGSYTEWSPSGHGVHVIGLSKLVLKAGKKDPSNSICRGGTSRLPGLWCPAWHRLDRVKSGKAPVPDTPGRRPALRTFAVRNHAQAISVLFHLR